MSSQILATSQSEPYKWLGDITYQWLEGAGTKPNRKIDFLKPEDGNPHHIAASISSRAGGKWKPLIGIKAPDIEVELMSSQDKLDQLNQQIQSGKEIQISDPIKKFSEMTEEEQKSILDNLEPEGPWRIEVHYSYDRTALKIGSATLKIFKGSIESPDESPNEIAALEI